MMESDLPIGVRLTDDSKHSGFQESVILRGVAQE